MAIKSSIYKAELSISDMDRHYYETHKLTLACHPSETELRLMTRLLVFALHASERLQFGKGVSDSDEPDLWEHNLSGDLVRWIELGHPEEKVVIKACGRSAEVLVYTYSAQPDRWLQPVHARLSREKKLIIRHFDLSGLEELSLMADKSMNLQCTIQDGEIWVQNDTGKTAKITYTQSLPQE